MDRFLLFAFVLAAIPISSSWHEDLAQSAVLLAFILVGAVALHI